MSRMPRRTSFVCMLFSCLTAYLAMPKAMAESDYDQFDLQGNFIGEIVRHDSNGRVCGDPLFGSAITGVATPVHPVDYCKELVIVDPAVLTELRQDAAFSRVLEVGRYTAWAQLWMEPTGTPPLPEPCVESSVTDVVCPHKAVNDLLHSVQPDQFRLIAIVNRLELRTPEIRFVYQLVHDNAIKPFSVIAEYRQKGYLPQLARQWHELGSPALTFDQYIAALKTIVQSALVSDLLLRLRTNENIDPHWRFRQFDYDKTTGTFKAASMERSLQDKFQGMMVRSSSFESFLRMNREFILNDDEAFYASPEWMQHQGYEVSIESTLDRMSYIWPALYQELFIIGFNTCNGCHHNSDTAGSDGFRHMVLREQGQPASLSQFLSGAVPMKYPLPGCIGQKKMAGCKNGSLLKRGTWNELKNRGDYLLGLALQAANASPMSTQPFQPATIKRVH